MLSVQPTISELYHACREIFGPEVVLSNGFINYLQLDGVKSAYKQRALETHPDRALTLGLSPHYLNDKFKKVKEAYEKLLGFVEKDKKIIINSSIHTTIYRKTSAHYHKPSSTWKNNSDRFYTGTVPKRKLLFGQFL
jgi:hypothetical protein